MHAFKRDRAAAVIETTAGALRGYEYDGLSVFKGIPYARARRFHAPEPVEKWSGVRDAGSYGFVCPLMSLPEPNGELYVPHRYWPMDENCQNVNVWTPAPDGKKRPVLVWLHGGGFTDGSAIEHIAYDGANMSRLGDAVVVSVNHRLNLLGYFDLSEFGEEYENAGNAGGDDIIAALMWIRDNIECFGGDPGNVTVFGQSGGGAKVTTLLQSPAADGLYAKGIVMSGVIDENITKGGGSGPELARALMRELGASDIRGLEKVDYHDLARATLRVKPALEKTGHAVGFWPHLNAHYAGDPLSCGFRAETADVPLMVGSVFGEFASFSPAPWDRDAMTDGEQVAALRDMLGRENADKLIPLFREAYPERHVIDLMRLDALFRAPEIRYIRARSALNRSTWSYLFNMDQPIDGGNTPWHCSDIPYAFHNIDLVEYPHGDGDLAERVQRQVFGAVMAFARTGDPNCDHLPAWPASRPDEEHTLVVDGSTRVKRSFDHALVEAFARCVRPEVQTGNGEVQH